MFQLPNHRSILFTGMPDVWTTPTSPVIHVLCVAACSRGRLYAQSNTRMQKRCQKHPQLHDFIVWLQTSLLWRHNGHDGVSNHQYHNCLLNHVFRRGSKKTSKLSVTGLCAGNSPFTGEFPAQMASTAENASIWWRHHVPQRPPLLSVQRQLVSFICNVSVLIHYRFIIF